jgi:hypothetical protein
MQRDAPNFRMTQADIVVDHGERLIACPACSFLSGSKFGFCQEATSIWHRNSELRTIHL